MDKTYKPINSMVKPDSEKLTAYSGNSDGDVELMYADMSIYNFIFDTSTFKLKNVVYVDPSGEERECKENEFLDKLDMARGLARRYSVRV